MTHAAENPTADERELIEAVRANLPETISHLSELVRTPSVSWDAFDPQHVQTSAEQVAAFARGTGIFDSVEIARSEDGAGALGQPAVLARRRAEDGYPTILLYAHHDVQPPGSDEDWETSPFEPVVKGDRLFGRGAADDKAGVMTHIAAIRSLVEVVGDQLALGVTLFIEGEEEFGSRSFASFLQDHKEALSADAIVVADSDNWTTDVPALTVSLRGNVTFTLTVRTLAHASHSGMYGGAAPDAMMAAVRLIDTFWTEDGSVAVAGLTGREKDAPEFSEAQLREDAALLPDVRPIGTGNVLSRLWTKPAITITGIDAPNIENASNTLVPEVTVKVSARIAPGQTGQEALDALRAHIRAHTPFGADVTLADIDTGDPFEVDTGGPIAQAALKAMERGWGEPPVESGIGGSIPFIADLVTEFPDAEILITGVEDPDTRAHSPNESLHLGVFRRAISSEALLLHQLNNSRELPLLSRNHE